MSRGLRDYSDYWPRHRRYITYHCSVLWYTSCRAELAGVSDISNVRSIYAPLYVYSHPQCTHVTDNCFRTPQRSHNTFILWCGRFNEGKSISQSILYWIWNTDLRGFYTPSHQIRILYPLHPTAASLSVIKLTNVSETFSHASPF